MELNTGDNESKTYKMEAICNSTIYIKKLKSGHLLILYYLVFWKNYSKKENT